MRGDVSNDVASRFLLFLVETCCSRLVPCFLGLKMKNFFKGLFAQKNSYNFVD